MYFKEFPENPVRYTYHWPGVLEEEYCSICTRSAKHCLYDNREPRFVKRVSEDNYILWCNRPSNGLIPS
jgi:hypothetical protein